KKGLGTAFSNLRYFLSIQLLTSSILDFLPRDLTFNSVTIWRMVRPAARSSPARWTLRSYKYCLQVCEHANTAFRGYWPRVAHRAGLQMAGYGRFKHMSRVKATSPQ